MKNRLICLLLCLVMVLTVVLTSCGEKTNGELRNELTEKASASAMTLTMWVVSEEPVSEATAKEVNDALNAITKPKFKTELIVKFFTEAEYRTALENAIVAFESTVPGEAVTQATTAASGDAAVTDETRVNDLGLIEIVYPGALENQVDLIYIDGEGMFNDFVESGWLAPLDEELSGNSKKIKEYVANTLISAVKQDGVTYAIPNNNVIGEYTYMLMDKTLMNKYAQQGYVQKGLIDNFCNPYVFSFLDQVAQNDPDYLPVDGTYEDCLNLMAHYWSIDPDNYSMLQEFSAFGYYYTDLTELSRGSVILGYESLFANEKFASNFLGLNKCRLNNYFGNAAELDKPAAVRFIKGDATTLRQYEDDYYAVIVEYPTASVEDIYSNMFGVYSHSKSVARSMEILTYLNTNADFRNTLQYGKEGVHYTLTTDADNNVTVEYDRYNRYIMDVYKTGNAFLAYPEPDMSADIWESGKVQNRYSLIEPLLDFDFAEFAATLGVQPTVTIDSKGYNLSVTSGYSKDVLSQNATLGAWLSACDAAGRGTYVFKTWGADESNTNLTTIYYVYNTELGSRAKLSVTETPIFTEVEGANGETVSRQIGVDLGFDYTDEAGAAPNGYGLSMVQVYSKKAYVHNVAYTNDGEENTAVAVTEQDALLVFDFLNTKDYTIEIYNGLSEAGVRDNQILTQWIKEKCPTIDRTVTTYALSYVEELEDKNAYTFVFYRNGLNYITATDLQVTGNDGECVINMLYTPSSGKKLDDSEPHYVMSYVRVLADKDVTVSAKAFTVGKNMTAVEIVNTEATEDPDFTILGNLDTELVKVMAALNEGINAMIAECDTYEELESLVKDLGILLDGSVIHEIDDFTDSRVIQFIRSCAGAGKDPQVYLNAIHEDLALIAAYTVMQTQYTPEGAEVLYENKEPFVYYASPYAVYYQWMETYGFLPAET